MGCSYKKEPIRPSSSNKPLTESRPYERGAVVGPVTANCELSTMMGNLGMAGLTTPVRHQSITGAVARSIGQAGDGFCSLGAKTDFTKA